MGAIVLQLEGLGRLANMSFVALDQGNALNLIGFKSFRVVGIYCHPHCTIGAIERLQRLVIESGQVSPRDPSYEDGQCLVALEQTGSAAGTSLVTDTVYNVDDNRSLKLLIASRSFDDNAYHNVDDAPSDDKRNVTVGGRNGNRPRNSRASTSIMTAARANIARQPR